MKMKKINLEDFGQSLSRSEMKEVMAGSGGSNCSECIVSGGGCLAQTEDYSGNCIWISSACCLA